jgi:hypothetical protein
VILNPALLIPGGLATVRSRSPCKTIAHEFVCACVPPISVGRVITNMRELAINRRAEAMDRGSRTTGESRVVREKLSRSHRPSHPRVLLELITNRLQASRTRVGMWSAPIAPEGATRDIPSLSAGVNSRQTARGSHRDVRRYSLPSPR